MSAQRPCASGPPFGTVLQIPGRPGTAHDRQIPRHSLAQQTPCSQNPDAQAPPDRHVWPLALGPHEPFMHSAGATQSVFELQPLLQRAESLAPSHWKGAQEIGTAGASIPRPSQTAAATSKADEHVAGAELVPCG